MIKLQHNMSLRNLSGEYAKTTQTVHIDPSVVVAVTDQLDGTVKIYLNAIPYPFIVDGPLESVMIALGKM